LIRYPDLPKNGADTAYTQNFIRSVCSKELMWYVKDGNAFEPVCHGPADMTVLMLDEKVKFNFFIDNC